MSANGRGPTKLTLEDLDEVERQYNALPYEEPFSDPRPGDGDQGLFATARFIKKAAIEARGAWDERLLGRPLFDVPSLDERKRWKAWQKAQSPDDDPVSIDVEVSTLMGANAGPAIRTDLASHFAAGWCPYYLARTHLAFAALMANSKLGWVGSDDICFAMRRVLDEKGKHKHIKGGSHVRQASQKARERLLAPQDDLDKIRRALTKMSGIFPKLTSDDRGDPMGYESLAPQSRYEIADIDESLCAALAIIRNKTADCIRLIDRRKTVTKENNAVPDAEDVSRWRQTFAGYMNVTWERLTGERPDRKSVV